MSKTIIIDANAGLPPSDGPANDSKIKPGAPYPPNPSAKPVPKNSVKHRESHEAMYNIDSLSKIKNTFNGVRFITKLICSKAFWAGLGAGGAFLGLGLVALDVITLGFASKIILLGIGALSICMLVIELLQANANAVKISVIAGEAQEEINEQKAAIDDVNRAVLSLREENINLFKNLDEIKENALLLQEENEKAQNVIEKQKENLNEAEKRSKILEENISGLSGQINDLKTEHQTEISQLKNDLDGAKELNDQNQSIIQNQKKELKNTEELLTTFFEKVNETATQSLAIAQKSHGQALSSIESIENVFNSSSTDLKKHAQNFRDLVDSEVNELNNFVNKNLNDLNQELANCKLAQSSKNQEKVLDSLNKMIKKFTNLNAQINEKTLALGTKIQEGLASYESEVDRHVQQMNEKIQQGKEELAKVGEDVKKLQTNVNQLQTHENKLNEKIETLNTNVAKLEENENKLNEKINDLNTKVDNLQSNEGALNKKINDLKISVETLESNRNTLADAIKAAKDENQLLSENIKLQQEFMKEIQSHLPSKDDRDKFLGLIQKIEDSTMTIAEKNEAIDKILETIKAIADEGSAKSLDSKTIAHALVAVAGAFAFGPFTAGALVVASDLLPRLSNCVSSAGAWAKNFYDKSNQGFFNKLTSYFVPDFSEENFNLFGDSPSF